MNNELTYKWLFAFPSNKFSASIANYNSCILNLKTTVTFYCTKDNIFRDKVRLILD